MMYPLPESIFIDYRLFKLMIDQSKLTFHIAILDLKNRKPLFFLFHFFAKFQIWKILKAKIFSLNVWNFFANELFKMLKFRNNLVFKFCFRAKWVTCFYSRFHRLVKPALWFFDDVILTADVNTWPQQWTLESDFVSSIFLYFWNSWPLLLSISHLTSKSLVTCSKWQFRGSPGH